MKGNKKALKFPLQLATASALAVSTLAFGMSAEAQSEAKDAYIQAEENEAAQVTTYLESRFQTEMDWAEQTANNASESLVNLSLEANGVPDFDPQIESIINSSYLEFLAQQDMNAQQLLVDVNANIGGANIDDLAFGIDQDTLIANLPFYDTPLTLTEDGIKRLAEENGESLGEFTFADFFATEMTVEGLDEEYFTRYNDLVYETLADESFTSEEVEEEIAGVSQQATVLTMQLSEEEIHEVVNVVLEELKNDEVIIEMLVSQAQVQTAGQDVDVQQEFVDSIDELQTEFSETQFPQGLTSTLYVVDDQVLKREVNTEIVAPEGTGSAPVDETTEDGTEVEDGTEDDATEDGTEVEDGTEDDATEDGTEVEDGTEDDATEDGTEVEDGTEDDATEDGTEVEDGTEDDATEDGTEEDGTEDDSASIGTSNGQFAAQSSEDDEGEEDVTEEEGTEDVPVEASDSVVLNYVSETALTETGSETVYTLEADGSVLEGTLSLSEGAEGFNDLFTLVADGEEVAFVQLDKANADDGSSDYTYTFNVGPTGEKVEIVWTGSATYQADSATGEDRITFSIPDVVTHDQLAVVLTTESRLINGVEMIDTSNSTDLSEMSSAEIETFFNTEIAESFNNWLMNLFSQTQQQ
ncbi:MAG TPA: hypothetical protein K8V35_08485 [Aliicoccus persicus]|uniref:Uncharacterized protein n=1 Tax=Aliicoccus persicus TaxID=930138 RepID=A0A921DYB7_9STAP|nr:hypothetical protein [Aliicoccus persicus]